MLTKIDRRKAHGEGQMERGTWEGAHGEGHMGRDTWAGAHVEEIWFPQVTRGGARG